MPKRDYITEILARKGRHHKRGSRWQHAARRLLELSYAFKYIDTPNQAPKRARDELFRYMPVAHVAAFKGFCRLAYADLISFGDPFLTNARALKDLRFSIEPVLAVEGGFASGGELIAHLLPHKSASDVQRNFSTLLGEDFMKKLESESFTPHDSDEPFPMAEISEAIWRGLHRIFEMRHIICHELATKVHFSPREIKEVTQQCVVFVIVTEQLLTRTLAETANRPANSR
ncbi:hypothetical protein GCM10011487_35120 [Steroidobacter agaridevorans]|uniref:RiboL-PSP-HEPN domain-containing protein n=1 Tax=Steroidobacter agaridevorans TaxID=2695856 RepID=A0A829YFV9_9GAMM|nr:hypothetical protein [Steroidobacter agaridevorans]GFE81512.1 hypothetical protein GCM10011487_35120 [Steroidobacter agaridevorans]